MKRVVLTAVLAVFASACFAQRTLGIEKTKTIKEEEVPVSVIVTFQKEITNPPQGTWTVHYAETINGTKTMLMPINYSFKEPGRKGKTIARISPTGKLEYAASSAELNSSKGED